MPLLSPQPSQPRRAAKSSHFAPATSRLKAIPSKDLLFIFAKKMLSLSRNLDAIAKELSDSVFWTNCAVLHSAALEAYHNIPSEYLKTAKRIVSGSHKKSFISKEKDSHRYLINELRRAYRHIDSVLRWAYPRLEKLNLPDESFLLSLKTYSRLLKEATPRI